MSGVRLLVPGDEAALERFLVRHADSSMFLRSNVRAAGLVDRGELFQGTYAAAFAGDEIVAVASHAWTGGLLVQAPERLADVVRLAVARSGRDVGVLIGPWGQVVAAHVALGLAPPPESARDLLFGLDLARLRIPPALAEGVVRLLPTRDVDLALAARWSVGHAVEAVGETLSPALEARSAAMTADLHGLGRSWLLWDGDVPVAYTAFNAVLPDVVQVGGVYTDPALRCRGHARAAVAASLLAARAAGATRAVLFTGGENVAAQRAYVALGFDVAGDYGLVVVPR